MKELEKGAEYVCGFLFNNILASHVVLIKKLKPEFMAGKLNAVGGKVELGETPLEAMRREFMEEAGVDVDNWQQFVELHDKDGWKITFFRAFSEKIWGARTIEKEDIGIYIINRIDEIPVMPNLRWLIPMALSFDRGERASGFVINEV